MCMKLLYGGTKVPGHLSLVELFLVLVFNVLPLGLDGTCSLLLTAFFPQFRIPTNVIHSNKKCNKGHFSRGNKGKL